MISTLENMSLEAISIYATCVNTVFAIIGACVVSTWTGNKVFKLIEKRIERKHRQKLAKLRIQRAKARLKLLDLEPDYNMMVRCSFCPYNNPDKQTCKSCLACPITFLHSDSAKEIDSKLEQVLAWQLINIKPEQKDDNIRYLVNFIYKNS